MVTSSGTGSERPEGYRVVVLVAGGPDGPRPRVHPAGEPLLLADDLAAVRGDGCFETLLLVNGRPAKPERHLARLARSSSALGITGGPTDDEWRAGIALAAREWGPGSEAMLRLVLSRGPERGGAETAYITVAPVGPHAVRARAEGIAVTALNRGFPADFAATAPWMLLGSKTLSYAANMAAIRHATSNGFDDVVYLSAEGEVLEGPRSTLVIARSGELVSPPVEVGILEGTTLAALAEVAGGQGIQVRRERLLMTDLLAADAVWLLSSVTLAARVRRIDAVTLPEADPGIDVAGMVDRAVGRA